MPSNTTLFGSLESANYTIGPSTYSYEYKGSASKIFIAIINTQNCSFSVTVTHRIFMAPAPIVQGKPQKSSLSIASNLAGKKILVTPPSNMDNSDGQVYNVNSTVGNPDVVVYEVEKSPTPQSLASVDTPIAISKSSSPVKQIGISKKTQSRKKSVNSQDLISLQVPEGSLGDNLQLQFDVTPLNDTFDAVVETKQNEIVIRILNPGFRWAETFDIETFEILFNSSTGNAVWLNTVLPIVMSNISRVVDRLSDTELVLRFGATVEYSAVISIPSGSEITNPPISASFPLPFINKIVPTTNTVTTGTTNIVSTTNIVTTTGTEMEESAAYCLLPQFFVILILFVVGSSIC